jgi:hypothetical protein
MASHARRRRIARRESISSPFFPAVIDDLNRAAALDAEYILQDLVFGLSGNDAPHDLGFGGWRSVTHGSIVAE